MGLNSYLVAVIPPYSPLGWRQISIIQTSIDFVSLNMFLMSNKKALSIVNTKHSNVACANANTCLFMWCINGQRRKRICLISFFHQKWKSEMLLGLIHKSSCKVVWELKTGPPSPLPHPCPGPPLTARGTSEAAATKCHHNCPAV